MSIFVNWYKDLNNLQWFSHTHEYNVSTYTQYRSLYLSRINQDFHLWWDVYLTFAILFACTSCSIISPAVRSPMIPIVPVAQNLHPIWQPICEEIQTVLWVTWRMITVSTSCPSCKRINNLVVSPRAESYLWTIVVVKREKLFLISSIDFRPNCQSAYGQSSRDSLFGVNFLGVSVLKEYIKWFHILFRCRGIVNTGLTRDSSHTDFFCKSPIFRRGIVISFAEPRNSQLTNSPSKWCYQWKISIVDTNNSREILLLHTILNTAAGLIKG